MEEEFDESNQGNPRSLYQSETLPEYRIVFKHRFKINILKNWSITLEMK